MNDVNTYVLMVELCKRLSDYLYDPEPMHDQVLVDMDTKTVADIVLMHHNLKESIEFYQDEVKERSEKA